MNKSVVFIIIFIIVLMFSHTAYCEKGETIFRLSDQVPFDGTKGDEDNWLPGHVGIYTGNGTQIIEACVYKCPIADPEAERGGWILVDAVTYTDATDDGWIIWYEGDKDFCNDSAAFSDSHFDYKQEVRDHIIDYAEDHLGEPYFYPTGWYCSKLVSLAYRYAVTKKGDGQGMYPEEHEPDYEGWPEEVTNLQSSHTTGAFSNDDTIDFTWTTAHDFGSVNDELQDLPYVAQVVYPMRYYDVPESPKGIDGYSIFLWDETHHANYRLYENSSYAYDTCDGNATSVTCTPASDGINWWFHIRSLDVSAHWSSSYPINPTNPPEGGCACLGIFKIDTTPPVVENISTTVE